MKRFAGILVSRVWGSSVAWSMGSLLLRFGGFAVVWSFALRNVPQDKLGLWYGMMSIAGLAACVELGFSTTIGRSASYFLAGASHVPSLGLSGAEHNLGRPNVSAIRGVVAAARRIYVILTIAYLVVAGVAAAVWASVLPDSHRWDVDSIAAFALLILGGAYNLYSLYWPAFLHGLQEVRLFNVYLCIGLIAGYAVSAAGIQIGGGILSLAAGQVVQAFVARLLSRGKVLSLVARLGEAQIQQLSWRVLWPMTWRTGVGLVAAQLILPLTPLVVSYLSLSQNASYGFALQVAFLIHGLSASWLVAAWPHISSLRAQGNHAAVRRVAAQRFTLAGGSFLCCALVIPVVMPFALELIGSRTPFLPPQLWALLATAAGLDLVIGGHAALIQTGNRATYLNATVIMGLLSAALAALLGHFLLTAGVLAGVVLAQVLVGWRVPFHAWRELRPRMEQPAAHTA